MEVKVGVWNRMHASVSLSSCALYLFTRITCPLGHQPIRRKSTNCNLNLQQPIRNYLKRKGQRKCHGGFVCTIANISECDSTLIQCHKHVHSLRFC